jgi:hypothetical protein
MILALPSLKNAPVGTLYYCARGIAGDAKLSVF